MKFPLIIAAVFCLAGSGAASAAPESRLNGSAQKNTVKSFGKLLDEADDNHDGALTREEAERTPALSSQFNSMDINQDGKVTHQEMIASMKMKSRHRKRYAEGDTVYRWHFGQ